MKTTYCLLLAFLIVGSVHSQSILNGDFENNSIADLINASNADYNEAMINSTAFGSSEQIDIFSNVSGFGLAQSGRYCIGLAVSSSDAGRSESISFDLTGQLIQGNTYSISFYDKALAGLPAPNIEIGVSGQNDSFGEAVVTVSADAIKTLWTNRVLEFTSPINAGFITIRVHSGTADSGTFLDNFSLKKVAESGGNLHGLADAILFPNPASDFLNIQMERGKEPARFTISNILGAIVIDKEYEEEQVIQLDISNLIPGIYYANIHTMQGEIITKKLIKE